MIIDASSENILCSNIFITWYWLQIILGKIWPDNFGNFLNSATFYQ